MSKTTPIKTIEQFAKLSGVTIIECSPEWGGRVGYKSDDHPNISICGFRSEKAALESWLSDTFGEKASKALKALMKQAAKTTGDAP